MLANDSDLGSLFHSVVLYFTFTKVVNVCKTHKVKFTQTTILRHKLSQISNDLAQDRPYCLTVVQQSPQNDTLLTLQIENTPAGTSGATADFAENQSILPLI
ncbi:hypothetical protein GCM10028791_41380 [Echinicola sediminis]